MLSFLVCIIINLIALLLCPFAKGFVLCSFFLHLSTSKWHCLATELELSGVSFMGNDYSSKFQRRAPYLSSVVKFRRFIKLDIIILNIFFQTLICPHPQDSSTQRMNYIGDCLASSVHIL